MATIKGTWIINSNADIASCPNEAVNFNSNGGSFTGMYVYHEVASYYLQYERAGGYELVCDSNGNTWTNSAYQTVDFGSVAQTVSDSFYSWISANATEQDSGGGDEEETYYTITLNLENITASNTHSNIREYSSYSNTLTPTSGYTIDSVTVKMDGVDITASAYSGNTVNIDEVTGDIVITATATEDLEEYTITQTLENTTASNVATSITEGSTYRNTLTADEGYTLDSVTVTMGGTNITASAYNNGSISISNVTGNIVITATATKDLQEFTITRTLTNVTASNTANTITEGNAYSNTLTATSGYTIDTIKVTMGGTDITSSAYSNGTVSILAVTGNIVITATARELEEFTITKELHSCVSASNKATTITEGEAYSCELSTVEGWAIKQVTVTMGGEDITATVHNNGIITIAAVTGDIVITATAKTESDVYSIVWQGNVEFIKSNTASAVDNGAAYTCTITPKNGYKFLSVNIVMSGDDITDTAYKDGVITIAAVTGTVVITVMTQRDINSTDTETFKITNTLTNITTSNTAVSVVAGNSYTATLTAKSGYIISTIKITMGDIDITASTYNNGVITISAVTGNIVVNAVGAKVAGGGDGSTDPAEPSSSTKVYVVCDRNCKYEGMTKEQIYIAIMQAVNEGTIGNIDAGFIQTINTINGLPLKFFVGEQAEYNALSEAQKENLFAIITNDTTKDGLLNTLESLSNEITSITEQLRYSNKTVKYGNGTQIDAWSIQLTESGIYSCVVRDNDQYYTRHTLLLHYQRNEFEYGVNPACGNIVILPNSGLRLGLYVGLDGVCIVENFDETGNIIKTDTGNSYAYVMEFTKII